MIFSVTPPLVFANSDECTEHSYNHATTDLKTDEAIVCENCGKKTVLFIDVGYAPINLNTVIANINLDEFSDDAQAYLRFKARYNEEYIYFKNTDKDKTLIVDSVYKYSRVTDENTIERVPKNNNMPREYTMQGTTYLFSLSEDVFDDTGNYANFFNYDEIYVSHEHVPCYNQYEKVTEEDDEYFVLSGICNNCKEPLDDTVIVDAATPETYPTQHSNHIYLTKESVYMWYTPIKAIEPYCCLYEALLNYYASAGRAVDDHSMLYIAEGAYQKMLEDDKECICMFCGKTANKEGLTKWANFGNLDMNWIEKEDSYYCKELDLTIAKEDKDKYPDNIDFITYEEKPITEDNICRMFISRASPYRLYLINPAHYIYYDANGGNGTMLSQEVYFINHTKLLDNDFTKEHSVFKGWSLDKDGTELIEEGKEIVFTNQDSNKMTLYAIWELKDARVIVNYVDTDGNEIAESETINGKVTDNYETEAKAINDYELSVTPANAKGVMTEDDITVNYVYKAKEKETVVTEEPTTADEPTTINEESEPTTTVETTTEPTTTVEVPTETTTETTTSTEVAEEPSADEPTTETTTEPETTTSKNTKTTKTKVVNTGDDRNYYVYYAILAAVLLFLLLLVRKMIKEKKEGSINGQN